MAKLVSMKETAAEEKAEQASLDSPAPDYPYGLRLSLGRNELKKLGMKDLPEIGDEFEIVARGKVVSISQSESERGDGYKCADIQITEMSLTDPDEEAEPDGPMAKAGSKLYPKGGK